MSERNGSVTAFGKRRLATPDPGHETLNSYAVLG